MKNGLYKIEFYGNGIEKYKNDKRHGMYFFKSDTLEIHFNSSNKNLYKSFQFVDKRYGQQLIYKVNKVKSKPEDCFPRKHEDTPPISFSDPSSILFYMDYIINKSK